MPVPFFVRNADGRQHPAGAVVLSCGCRTASARSHLLPEATIFARSHLFFCPRFLAGGQRRWRSFEPAAEERSAWRPARLRSRTSRSGGDGTLGADSPGSCCPSDHIHRLVCIGWMGRKCWCQHQRITVPLASQRRLPSAWRREAAAPAGGVPLPSDRTVCPLVMDTVIVSR